MTADYRGSAAHQPSQGSDDVAVTLEDPVLDQTTTTLVCTPDAVNTSEPSNCVATVRDDADPATTPSGRVEFDSNAVGAFSDAATCILSEIAAGEASCAIDYTPVLADPATHKVFATYQGDASHRISQGSDEIDVTLEDPELNETQTAVKCDPASLEAGKATSCLATVTDVSPNPSQPNGEVSFDSNRDGAFNPASCTLTAAGANAGTCKVDFTPSAVGTHKVFATYGGEATHRLSQGRTQVEVSAEQGGGDKEATTTEVKCDPASVAAKATTNCTAMVANATDLSAASATGQVEFSSDGPGGFPGDASCTLTDLGQGKASCALAYVPTAVGSGTHTITGSYKGDAAHETSSGTFALTVTAEQGGGGNGDPTDTALTCRPGTVILGGGAACTVIVTDTAATGATQPTGKVKFFGDPVGTFPRGETCDLAAFGNVKARCQVVFKPGQAVPTEVLAAYQGDAAHEKSEGSTQLTVAPDNGGAVAATNVTCEPGTVTSAAPLVCTVTVADTAGGKASPGGLVVFASDQPGDFGTGGCALFPDGNGKSRCQIIYTPSAVGSGIHTITALYSGAPGFKPGEATAQVLVNQPNNGHKTTTTVACQPGAVNLGNSSKCLVTVLDTDASPIAPGGRDLRLRQRRHLRPGRLPVDRQRRPLDLRGRL